tara:strand:- start:8663 stop:9349 length:687 start_codon:yes stop_codon:yes gene_type:complete
LTATPTAAHTPSNDVCIIQFAKRPQLNRVKTRMQPRLSAQQSLQLHSDLVAHTFQSLRSPSEWDYQLWVSGRGASPDFFDKLVELLPVPIEVQQGGDLGARMADSLRQVLQSYRFAIIVGSDCPELDTGRLQDLIVALRSGLPAALIPADDGGYVALGLSRFSEALFQGIDWGTDRVYEQTIVHLQRLEWSFYRASSLPDIDRPEDLTRLRDYAWGHKWFELAPSCEP